MKIPNGDNEEEMIEFNKFVRDKSLEVLKNLEERALTKKEEKRKKFFLEAIQKSERYLIERAQKEWKNK